MGLLNLLFRENKSKKYEITYINLATGQEGKEILFEKSEREVMNLFYWYKNRISESVRVTNCEKMKE